MSKKDRQSFFWASYTDLMTSLFFVMLVLYLLTFIMLKVKQGEIELEAEKYRQIKNIQEKVRDLTDKKTVFKGFQKTSFQTTKTLV